MTRIPRLVTLSVVVLALSLVSKPLIRPARSQTGCTAASLSGPYGMGVSGSLFAVPGAAVATMAFDGRGAINPTHLGLSVAGVVDPVDLTGTYTVNSDCTGKLVIQTAHHSPPRSHYHEADMVVVDGGRQAYLVVGGPKDSPSDAATPGEVLSGLLTRL